MVHNALKHSNAATPVVRDAARLSLPLALFVHPIKKLFNARQNRTTHGAQYSARKSKAR